MKRFCFITLCRYDGEITPVWVNGYTDATFHYYKLPSRRYWYAIFPGTGIALGEATTRKEARIQAFDSLPRFMEYMKKHGDSVKERYAMQCKRLDVNL